ncbi:hypothetical protein YC2023_040190 [Brassica napus]
MKENEKADVRKYEGIREALRDVSPMRPSSISGPPLSCLLVLLIIHSVIHGFTPVGRANHYMPSLKADSIVKVDRFEVARCSSMYKITDHSFLIRFISLTIIDEVITGASEINLQSRLDCSTISK